MVYLYVMCEKKDRCPYCLGTNLRPKGWKTKANGKRQRRFKCQDCKKHILLGGRNWFVSDEQLSLIQKLLLERISLRGICRVVGISLSWLLLYIKRLYAKQTTDLNYRLPQKHQVILQLIDCELDEMWSFVHNKENKQWLWIALCRKTRQVIAFHIGGRARTDAKKLWKALPKNHTRKGLFLFR